MLHQILKTRLYKITCSNIYLSESSSKILVRLSLFRYWGTQNSTSLIEATPYVLCHI